MSTSPPPTPRTPRTPRSRPSSARPSAPPPNVPLPPLPPASPPRFTAGVIPSLTSPQLPPLPSLSVLSANLPRTPRAPDEGFSPASSHFSSAGGSLFSDFAAADLADADSPSTRPSSADSDTPESSPDDKKPPRQRLERAKSVTVEGFDFDLVTPQLRSLGIFGAPGAGTTSPPDTPTAEGAVQTPKAEDCGCDAPLSPSSPESPISSDADDYDEFDEEAERLLQEAGLGGLGLGLMRRQSEAVMLARAAGVRHSTTLPGLPGLPSGSGLPHGRASVSAGPPASSLPPIVLGPAAAKLVKRKEAEKLAEKKAARKKKEEFDRFGLPTLDAIEAARKCEVLAEGGFPVTFDQLIKDRKAKVVVIFLRHSWCGLCAQFVTALTKATSALTSLSTASISGDSVSSTAHIPPVYVLLISNGSHTLIPTYRARLDCPFPLYMDRSRKLYKALGMNKKSWNMGSDSEKGSYIVKSQLGNVTSSIAAGVAMPAYPGSQGQLGGEFVFEYNEITDDIRCCYAARMHTTRAHSEIKDIFLAAGVRLNEEDSASVYGGQ